MNEHTMDKARDFIFRGLLSLDSLQQLEHTGVYLRDSHRRLGSALAELTFAEFSAPIRDGAEKMARLYVAFFCFENSVRELVAQKLRDAYADTWWDTRVPPTIKNKVENRKTEEQKNKWHQPRSRSNINYTDFGDMPGIILNNWIQFEDIFDSQDWVKARFGDMEKSRNVIAHNNVLEDQEIERIRLYLQDWARIAGL
jgi:Swt1-like HEPN